MESSNLCSWRQEDRIGTLSFDVLQLLHRYYLVFSSQDPRDGVRLEGVHRRRQGGMLADFKCEKQKHSSMVSENHIREESE